MTTARQIWLFSVASVMLMSVPSIAQERPELEFSAGYDLLRVTRDPAESLPSGWYAEFASNVRPAWAIALQITGHYQNLDPAKLHTVGGGIRWQSRHSPAAPFGQILIGWARLGSNSVTALPPNAGPLRLGLRGSASSLFFQIGAGMDLMRNSPIGIRVRGDFMRLDNNFGNMFRFAAGVVVPIRN